jgi:hypothetical protein
MKQIIFRIFVFFYIIPVGSLLYLYAKGPDQITVQEQLQRSKGLLQQLENKFHAKSQQVTQTERLLAVLEKHKDRFSKNRTKMQSHLTNKLVITKKKQSAYAGHIRRAQNIVAKLKAQITPQ